MLIDVQAVDENLHFTHMQNVTPIIDAVQDIKQNSDRGFTKERKFQHIGRVPYYEWMRLCQINPALKDPNELEKWLYTDEGEAYRIATKNHVTGSGIQIIMR